MVSESDIKKQENVTALSEASRYHHASANSSMVSAIFAMADSPETMKNTIDDLASMVAEFKFLK